MLWNNLLHKGLVAGALGALLIVSACTFTIQPEADMGAATPAPQSEPTSSGEETGGSEAMAVAEFVLPDGTSCLFSGTDATVAFGDKRVNYTCTPIISTHSISETLAILDDPVVTGPTEYFVDLAVIAQTDGGFELHSSQVISFTAWEIVLADGRVCLHAGFGATMGFEGQRLNYTCDKGDSTADEVGLMGELVNQGEGVWLAQIDEIGSDTSGFTQLSSTQVPVTKVSGVEVRPGGESAVTPEVVVVGNELIGPTWQWERSLYEGDMVVLANDPSLYTIAFNEDGTVGVQFDCNSGGGSYTVDGATLTFSPLVSTRMACPEGSQDSVFAEDLAAVISYVFADGNLQLTLSTDGVMEFSPVE